METGLLWSRNCTKCVKKSAAIWFKGHSEQHKKYMLLAYSVAVQCLNDIGHLNYGRFHKLFWYLARLLGRVKSSSQGLYLYRTAKHRKMRTNFHELSGFRTHDSSARTIKAYFPDRAATVLNYKKSLLLKRAADIPTLTLHSKKAFCTHYPT